MNQLERIGVMLCKPIQRQLSMAPTGASGLLFSAGVVGGVNLVGFAITAALKTHKITDLTGAGAFVINAAACAWTSGAFAAGRVRPMALNIAVGLWGTRLATYLFARILKTGEDERLNAFYPAEDEGWLDTSRACFPVKLAGFWSIQAMWGWIVSFPVTIANFSKANVPLGVGGKVALAMFAVGLGIETVADYQKFQYKSNSANKGHWTDTGLWQYSRHPNYLGELMMWWAMLGAAFPMLRGPRQLALGLASPLFITTLILFVSGLPQLESKADKQYHDNAAYQEYKRTTGILIPNLHSFFKTKAD